MGYADANVKTASSGAGAEEEGFRAAFMRKRQSLFGRPESIASSADLNAAPLNTAPTQVQGVLYHNLSEKDQATAGDRKAQGEPNNRRRSLFGGRFKLGGQKTDQETQDSSPPKLEPISRPLHARGLSAPADAAEHKVQHISEEDFYREYTKSSISPPFHFQHVTHTHKKHLPALETVDEKDLTKRFWAASGRQAPKKQLKGIRAEDVSNKLESMGVVRGAESSTSSTQVRAARPKPPLPMFVDTARSSREDITALPGFSMPQPPDSRLKRSEIGTLRGRQNKSDSTSPGAAQDLMMGTSDTHNALLGIKRDSRAKNSVDSLLGTAENPLASSVSSARRSEQPTKEESKRLSDAFRGQKVSIESSRTSKRELSTLLGFKDRSMSESSHASSRTKRDEINALLGMPDKRSKRQSKTAISQTKQAEIDALLGVSRQSKRFEPMPPPAPPAPPRPRRSNEESRPSLSSVAHYSQSQPAPERPRRDSKDVQYLRQMGFGQLLYRENSNESQRGASMHRATSNDSQPNTLYRQNSADSQNTQPMPRHGSHDSRQGQQIHRSNSNEPRYSPKPTFSQQNSPQSPQSPQSLHHFEAPRRPSHEDTPSYPGIGAAFGAVAEDVSRAQQVRFRSRQPLPALPNQANMNSPEGRSPLQTVSEVGEAHSPLRSPADSAVSPRSPNSLHSAHRTVRSPELTGPGMPDDETWEHEIDFLYSKEAEASNEFDWEAASMTPQRLSVREPDKRRSLNIPSASATPAALRLTKKLSEGSLRTSIYVPHPKTQQSAASHAFAPPKHIAYLDAQFTDATGASMSPEVKVVDVDEKRQEPALHMHGYESIAAGYLSDQESNSERSQHRKSNSYSSWESRPSFAKEQIRHSNASLSSVPDLTYPRRQPKQPITSIQGVQPGYHDLSPNPMNEYAAFTKGPYAQQEDTPTSTDYVSHRRPENISQNAILRAAVTRTAKDTQAKAHRWSRVVPSPSGPALTYSYEQQAGWL